MPDNGADVPPFARLDDGTADGARGNRVIGTYLHGALEDPRVCGEILGIAAPESISKAGEYVKLGQWFEQHSRGLEELGILR